MVGVGFKNCFEVSLYRLIFFLFSEYGSISCIHALSSILKFFGRVGVGFKNCFEVCLYRLITDKIKNKLGLNSAPVVDKIYLRRSFLVDKIKARQGQ